MDLGKLHQYLGELLEVGTDPRMPIVLPGQHREALPEELSDAMLIDGPYQADPAPLAKGYTELQGACLLLHGVGFDLDNLSDTHSSDWPIVEAP
ncbi:hypothetical protein QYE73_22890 [Pseudomonas mosselii]|uniref:hypothetical protein n=1 Tax=Pseudomonas mosselii TaxID=78327 RepID=UPI002634A746|nr:hypothetical protein [Pseudomonas mosselii]MDN4500139.1 hypothetical protein [Pseudomonas mosselii]